MTDEDVEGHRLLLAAALLQELRERPQRLDREQLERRRRVDGLTHQLLGLLVAALCGADDAQGHRRRDQRRRVLWADRLQGAQGQPLRLLDAARTDEELRQAALDL